MKNGFLKAAGVSVILLGVIVGFQNFSSVTKPQNVTPSYPPSTASKPKLRDIVVKFPDSTSRQERMQILKPYAIKTHHFADSNKARPLNKRHHRKINNSGFNKFVHVDLRPELDVDEVIQALEKDPRIESVGRDQVLELASVPNDPRLGEVWGLNGMGVTWDQTTGDRDIVVAVIDTGIDHAHQDLHANIWVNPGEIPNNGIDDDGNGFIDDSEGFDWGRLAPAGDYSAEHGTHVAGIIGAVGNNGVGVSGVNWKVRIMDLKVASLNAYGEQQIKSSDVMYAIQYATNNGADVINMSFGGYGSSDPFEQTAIDAAYASGVVVVASAGNNGNAAPMVPAGLNHVLAVAASDSTGVRANFSSYGPNVALTAPGVDVLSTLPGDTYGKLSGTSMASPYIAGVAALMLARNPELSVDEVTQILEAQADDAGDPGRDDKYGYGLVNPQRAVAAVLSVESTLRSEIQFPENGQATMNAIDVVGTASANNFSNYVLEYSLPGGSQWLPLAQSDHPVIAGVLGRFDPEQLGEGEFTLRLTVNTTDGKTVRFASKITVDRSIPTLSLSATTDSQCPQGVRHLTLNLSDNTNLRGDTLELLNDGVVIDQITFDKDGQTSTYSFDYDPNLYFGDHRPSARVIDRAGNSASSNEILVPQPTPLTAPVPQASIYDLQATLKWSPTNISGASYHVDVSCGGSPVSNASSISGTSYVAQRYDMFGHTVALSGTCSWRVRAESCGLNSDWSNDVAFVPTDLTPPYAPSLSSPANGSTVTSPPLITWHSAVDLGGIASYDVQVSHSSSFSTVASSATITTLSWQLPAPSLNGTYYFRVRAKDRAGNVGAWSDPFKFILADKTGPKIDSFTPASGASVKDPIAVALSASDASGIASVELFVNGDSISKDKTAPFKWSVKTTGFKSGSTLTLKAVAIDGNGNKTTITHKVKLK